jgi:branched-chain amino acid transport system substrate-binding protein
LALVSVGESQDGGDGAMKKTRLMLMFTKILSSGPQVRMKRGLFQTSLVLLLLGVLSVVLSVPDAMSASTETPYKIGILMSVTGPFSAMGSAGREGALLAVERINSQGGINGHPLELLLYDDQSDPSKGVLALQKLVHEDRVLGIGGPISTGVGMACVPIAEEAKVSMICLNSSSWTIAVKPWNTPNPPSNIRQWIFKPTFDSIFQYMVIYSMLKEKGVAKVASINANHAMGKAMRDAMEATYKKAGLDVVIWEEYGAQDTDMTAQLMKMKKSNFDAIVISGGEMAGGITYKQAREMGITKPIAGMPPLANVKIIGTLGKALDGFLVPSYAADLSPELLAADDPQRPAVAELTKLIAAKTGRSRADGANANGWDSVFLLADALRRANPDLNDLGKARAQVRDALETTKGFVGTIAMGDMSKWHEIPAPMILTMVKNGTLLPIGKKLSPTWKDLQ